MITGRFSSAERVGFEPTVATGTTTVFETVPFNRSGTSPMITAKGDYTAFFNFGALNLNPFVLLGVMHMAQTRRFHLFL